MKIKQHGLVYLGIIALFIVFALLLIALVGREILGFDLGGEETGLQLMDRDRWEELDRGTQGETDAPADCLFIYDNDADGEVYKGIMEPMLDQMRVAYRDVRSDAFVEADLEGCRTAVICTTDLSRFGEGILHILDWIQDGGRLFFAEVSDSGSFMSMISRNIGIVSMSQEPVQVSGFTFTKPFMIGSDREYRFSDPYDSSYELILSDDCEVYLESADERKIPLVWRKALGGGTVVVSNLGYMEKNLWGVYAACYSLLEEAFAWPVINGSAFFLDDFPGPVSNAVDQRIMEEYGLDVKKFFSQVWWRDMQALAKEYDLKYTAALIEDYTEDVTAPFDSNGLDTTAFRNYGMGVLSLGGEIGYHGYNHMPLALEDFDFQHLEGDFVPWSGMGDMEAGLKELHSFCAGLYPNVLIQTYVPPAGILSPEGRRMIAEKFPGIRIIAGTYVPDGISFVQDFDVSPDGIVNVPRVVSGYEMEDFGYLSAFSELNFHYVQSHYQHPFDVLAGGQGQRRSWSDMKEQFGGYLDWIYDSAPGLRSMTATELAAAVQRYDALTVEQTCEADRLVLELGNFADEAWLLVRLNGREPGAVEGGSLEAVLEGLYLLEAQSGRVEIELQ